MVKSKNKIDPYLRESRLHKLRRKTGEKRLNPFLSCKEQPHTAQLVCAPKNSCSEGSWEPGFHESRNFKWTTRKYETEIRKPKKEEVVCWWETWRSWKWWEGRQQSITEAGTDQQIDTNFQTSTFSCTGKDREQCCCWLPWRGSIWKKFHSCQENCWERWSAWGRPFTSRSWQVLKGDCWTCCGTCWKYLRTWPKLGTTSRKGQSPTNPV